MKALDAEGLEGGDTGSRHLREIAKIARERLARSASRLAAACVTVLCTISCAAFGSEVLEQKFDGVVAPRLWVQVVPQVDGVISRILVAPGQRVAKGDVLFEMDGEEYAIDVRIAEARRVISRQCNTSVAFGAKRT
jgi:multidrug resistance efflux pump